MFPTGWPGIALLMLRLALSANLLHLIAELLPNVNSRWIFALLATEAIALAAGLFTPVTAVLCALIEVMVWHFASATIMPLHVCVLVVAMALAMLGPGAYSLDSRLFGRRQIIFPPGEEDNDE